MIVRTLEIKRTPSYATPANQLVGVITLAPAADGPGAQEIILSSKAVSSIFGLIRQEIYATAKETAKLIPRAMDEAVHGPLVEASSQLENL